RRRHTRFSRDWSSDVCSSDLSWVNNICAQGKSNYRAQLAIIRVWPTAAIACFSAMEVCPLKPMAFRPAATLPEDTNTTSLPFARSEERRVGKECSSRSYTEEE